MKYRRRLLKGLLIFLLVIILLPVIAFFILYYFVLPPEKLTPLVVRYVNEQIDANFECNEIELTFFSTYPNLGIRIDKGFLVSNVAHDTIEDVFEYKGLDTLLAFSNCEVVFKAMDYLKNKEISISNIVLDDACLYGYVNSAGKANWEIWETLPTDTTTLLPDTIENPLPPIYFSRIKVKNATFAYYDRTSQIYSSLYGLSLDVKSKFTDTATYFDIGLEWDRFRFFSPMYSLQNAVKLQLKTRLKATNNYNSFSFPDTKLLVNQIPFSVKGKVNNYPENGDIDMDIEYELNVPNVEDLLTFIPKKYLDEYKLKTKGEVNLAGTVKGVFNENSYPVITSDCLIKDASLSSGKTDYKIEQLALDMNLKIDMASNKNTHVNLKKALIKSQHFNLDVKAKLSNLLVNPIFDGTIKSDINFTELSKKFFDSDTLDMYGNFLANLETRLSLNDVLDGNYGKIQATGEVDISDFKLLSKPYELDITVTNAKLAMTSERKIERLAQDTRMLNGKINVDSLNIIYSDEINTNLKNLYVSLTTPTIPDTTGIIPITGRVSFDRMRTRLPDSVTMRAGKTEIKGGLFPSPENKQVPVIRATADSDSLIYFMRQVRTGTLVTGSSIEMKIVPYVAQRRERSQRNITRDTTIIRQRRSVERDSTLILTGASSDLLSKWEATGKLGFKNMRLWSAYFPLRIELAGSNLQFTSNDVNLSNTRLTLGKSDFILNGKITNIRRALLRGGSLSGELTTVSNYIDCDELMDAIAKGVSYSERQNALENSNFSFDDLNNVQKLAEAAVDDTITGVFVLPSYLNLSLTTKAKAVDYGYLKLRNTNGSLVLRNQSVQITNLYSQSNVGSGGISMFYTARNKKGASLGIDIDMKNIMVDKFIELAPSIDTLLPMLQSFEGVLDCQMVATCSLDSTSSVILPDLQAACYLRGKDMVLLDGETFAEISKKLMFKNKKRNMIDSIAVDITVSNSDVEIYPFLLEIDRYRLAVGGTHNFDMSFNYHISVLKSPVPFKLGVDVNGTTEKFKYKITKCKYKDMFKTAKTGTIDTTRLNVRREIYHAIQSRIRNNLNDSYQGRRFSQKLDALPPDSLRIPLAEHSTQNYISATDSVMIKEE